MKNLITKVATLFAVVILAISMTSITAFATTQEFETRTRSALLVDRSGSIKDQEEVNSVMSTLDKSEYDFIGYFDDSQISLDPEYKGGGNSAICETVDKVVQLGYTNITVVTDGQQWPRDYSSLGIYTDVNLTICLVGEKEKDSEELVNQLKNRLVNSSLRVEKTDGEEEIVLDDYTPEVFSVETPEMESSSNVNSGNTSLIDNNGKCYWWVALILAVIIAALFDFIHELLMKHRDEKKTHEEEKSKLKPMPVKAVEAIAKGARVLADYSGSMKKQQAVTADACKQLTKAKVICFGEDVSEVRPSKMSRIKAQGKTSGWEAMEQASAKGWQDIVIVSDLGFNGKPFDENSFDKKFNKVTVVAPEIYDKETLANIQKIADEVEVLPL